MISLDVAPPSNSITYEQKPVCKCVKWLFHPQREKKVLLCHLQPCTFRVKSCLSPSMLQYLKVPGHTWGQTHTSRECSSPSMPKVSKSPALNNQQSQSRSVFVAPRTSQQTSLCLASAVFPVFPPTFLLIFSPHLCWAVFGFASLHGECQMSCIPRYR